jgi:hypothetical protein
MANQREEDEIAMAIRLSEQSAREEDDRRKRAREAEAAVRMAEELAWLERQLRRDAPVLERPVSFDPTEIERAIAESLAAARIEDAKQLTLIELFERAAPPKASRHRFRRYVLLEGTIVGRVVGTEHRHVRKISADAGANCTIQFVDAARVREIQATPGLAAPKKELPACLVIEADTDAATEEAEDKITARICAVDFDKLKKKAVESDIVPFTSEERHRHIFIDNSNIYIGAVNQGDAIDYTIRVKPAELGRLLSRGGVPGRRIVAGSKPPSTNNIWKKWEEAGFRVSLSQRDNSTDKEEHVDSFLHAQMYRELNDRRADAPGSNTLVLATGDGNSNEGYSNFVEVARAAARSGWRVEVWCWRKSLSRNFVALGQQFPDARVQIKLLDDHDPPSFTFHVIPRREPPHHDADAKRPHGDRREADKKSPVRITRGLDAKMVAGVAEAKAVEADAHDAPEECVICLDSVVTHLVTPCGHYCLCEGCSKNLRQCPVCRGDAESVVRVFKP